MRHVLQAGVHEVGVVLALFAGLHDGLDAPVHLAHQHLDSEENGGHDLIVQPHLVECGEALLVPELDEGLVEDDAGRVLKSGRAKLIEVGPELLQNFGSTVRLYTIHEVSERWSGLHP
jgi:hypothetical protein